MAYLPEDHRLKVAMIYSYGANEADVLDGELMDENPEDTSTLSQSDKDALQEYRRVLMTTTRCLKRIMICHLKASRVTIRM